ncbi:hypothetical protein JCM17380_38750 [Desulfosporosinus burensis]
MLETLKTLCNVIVTLCSNKIKGDLNKKRRGVAILPLFVELEIGMNLAGKNVCG